ncbi:unnamed protein product [Oncorhynchus mykiss]|uniref:Uncharacterized protein n=1 Tax=Oncorhynchus mykiss TaxID=8022 RepID=A0A060YCR8_ONCMY|nr:unnamed protein product [Oncorhynchus mykiss]
MAAQFLENCKSTISDCTRLLLTDRRDGLQPSIARLANMLRSLRWASGHLIDEEMASNLIAVAEKFLQQANYIQQREHNEDGKLLHLYQCFCTACVAKAEIVSFYLSCVKSPVSSQSMNKKTFGWPILLFLNSIW